MKFYLSDDAKYDPGLDTFLEQVATGSLRAGSSKPRKLNYSLPAGMMASGKYVIAVINEDNAVTEGDETNNQIVYGLVSP